jgi:SAM-dependent methyltransferase
MEPRPNATALPINWDQKNRAKLDFIQAFISRPGMMLRPITDAHYEGKAQSVNGNSTPTHESISEIMDGEPLVQYLRFLRRKSQDMKWVALTKFMQQHESDISKWLGDQDEKYGKLVLDSSMEMPDYYATGFHHQPGGFADNEFSGLMYDVGLDISFAMGSPGGVADLVPDNKYERILDLGCGSGRSTEPFKARFTESQVMGIDPSEPLLRTAVKRAKQKNLVIDYYQGIAESTPFPDNHFDLLTATILFHEVSDNGALEILKESRRILKPGGILVIGDLLPYSQSTAYDRWYDEWQVVHNNEPFFADAKTRDMNSLGKSAGFGKVEENFRGKPSFFGDRKRVPGMPYIVTATK